MDNTFPQAYASVSGQLRSHAGCNVPKNTSVVSGRITIDDFHERYYLFVSASTNLTLNGTVVNAGSLPETDRAFTDRLREGLGLDGRRIFPAGIDSPGGFRIIRLLDDGPVTLPADFPHALENPGDSSLAVTVGGHIASDEEMSNHSDLTSPTIALEKVVPFEAIQQRAFDISRSSSGASPIDNWLHAEQELLGSAT